MHSIEKLTAALQTALADATVQERFAELGTTTVSNDLATPAAHSERLASQIELWKGVFESAGVQPQ